MISNIVGSYAFLEAMQTHLLDLGSIAPKRIRKHASVWRVYYSHRDSLRLASVLYSEAGPHLARKREVFEDAASRPLIRTPSADPGFTIPPGTSTISIDSGTITVSWRDAWLS